MEAYPELCQMSLDYELWEKNFRGSKKRENGDMGSCRGINLETTLREDTTYRGVAFQEDEKKFVYNEKKV